MPEHPCLQELALARAGGSAHERVRPLSAQIQVHDTVRALTDRGAQAPGTPPGDGLPAGAVGDRIVRPPPLDDRLGLDEQLRVDEVHQRDARRACRTRRSIGTFASTTATEASRIADRLVARDPVEARRRDLLADAHQPDAGLVVERSTKARHTAGSFAPGSDPDRETPTSAPRSDEDRPGGPGPRRWSAMMTTTAGQLGVVAWRRVRSRRRLRPAAPIARRRCAAASSRARRTARSTSAMSASRSSMSTATAGSLAARCAVRAGCAATTTWGSHLSQSSGRRPVRGRAAGDDDLGGRVQAGQLDDDGGEDASRGIRLPCHADAPTRRARRRSARRRRADRSASSRRRAAPGTRTSRSPRCVVDDVRAGHGPDPSRSERKSQCSGRRVHSTGASQRRRRRQLGRDGTLGDPRTLLDALLGLEPLAERVERGPEPAILPARLRSPAALVEAPGRAAAGSATNSAIVAARGTRTNSATPSTTGAAIIASSGKG